MRPGSRNFVSIHGLTEGTLVEKPRARRYPFAASIELVEMESGSEIRCQTTDISSFGCQVNVMAPWATGSKVRLRIVHRGAVLSALGMVANVRTKGGMGVVYTQIEEKQQAVLDKWLAELRDTHERVTARR
jgi:PilZ domain